MEFSEEFMSNPSWGKIEKCKKDELLVLARCYDVTVAPGARKDEVKRVLCAGLVESGVLPALVTPERGERVGAATTAEAEVVSLGAGGTGTEVAAGMVSSGKQEHGLGSPGGEMSTEDLRLALKMKEVETKNKELEVQKMHLHVRALELPPHAR